MYYDYPFHMAKYIEKCLGRNWDKVAAINYVLDNHTWDQRVMLYHQLIQKELLCTVES